MFIKNEADLHPEIIMARFFETAPAVQTSTKQRTAQYYETSIYSADSGFLHANGETYPMHKWAIRFIKPGDTVCSTPPFACMTVIFRLGNDIPANLLDSIPVFFDGNEALADLYRKIIRLCHSGEVGSKLLMNSCALKLLYELWRISAAERKMIPAVKACMDYIQKNYAEKITLETIGNISGYVPLHIFRLFKKATGKTPHEYLTEIRISHAKRLLENTADTISEIAVKCGFYSLSHFQVLFKKATGAGPGKYRKNLEIYDT